MITISTDPLPSILNGVSLGFSALMPSFQLSELEKTALSRTIWSVHSICAMRSSPFMEVEAQQLNSPVLPCLRILAICLGYHHLKQTYFFAQSALASFVSRPGALDCSLPYLKLQCPASYDPSDRTHNKHYLKLLYSASHFAWLCDHVQSSLQTELS